MLKTLTRSNDLCASHNYLIMSTNHFEKADAYISTLFGLEDEAVTAVDAAIQEAGLGWLCISPVQGKFLNLLATLCRAQRIWEIGTCGGYSGVWLARALSENGRLVSLELEPEYAALAEQNFERAGLAAKTEVRVGDAMQSLQKMIDNNEPAFDMVFIDADKPPYPEYLKLAMELSRPGTLIVADNVIRYARIGETVQPTDEMIERTEAIRRFGKEVAANPKLDATFLQMAGVKEPDGMAFMVVRS